MTDETWEAVGAWTRKQQLPLHTHGLESPYQAKYAHQQWGSIVTHIDGLGALHEQTSLVHGVGRRSEFISGETRRFLQHLGP